jgi:biopolymer transport protein ExbD
MLTNQSYLKDTAMQSPLANGSVLNPQGGGHKRTMGADLLLTALIDAFSILVIFLLMSFSSTGDLLQIGKGTELPKAARTDVLERNPVVKVEEGQMFLEDKKVTQESLVGALLELRKQFTETRPNEEYPGTVTIQADRRVPYSVLNAIVLAASHAGFSDVHFAVLVK